MMDSSIWIVAVVAAVVLILTILLFCKAWFILRRNGHPSFLYSHRTTTTATPYGHPGPIGASRSALTLPTQHLHLNLNSTTMRRPIQVTAVEPGPVPPAVIDYSSVYSVHSHPSQTIQSQPTTNPNQTSQLHSGFLNLGYQEESRVGASITVELDETSSVPVPVPNACDYFEFDPPPSYREAIFLSTRHQPQVSSTQKATHNKK